METYTEFVNRCFGKYNYTLIEKFNSLVHHFVLAFGYTPDDIEEFDGNNENDFRFIDEIENDLQGEYETECFYTVVDYLANSWNGGKTAREVFNKAIILYINDKFSQE